MIGTTAAATTSVPAPSDSTLPTASNAAYARRDDRSSDLPPGRYRRQADQRGGLSVEGIPGVALFETKTDEIARYAAITGPLGVGQAPALIVLRDKDLNNGGSASATVDLGFQTADDVRQAIVDLEIQGPELTYAPN